MHTRTHTHLHTFPVRFSAYRNWQRGTKRTGPRGPSEETKVSTGKWSFLIIPTHLGGWTRPLFLHLESCPPSFCPLLTWGCMQRPASTREVHKWKWWQLDARVEFNLPHLEELSIHRHAADVRDLLPQSPERGQGLSQEVFWAVAEVSISSLPPQLRVLHSHILLCILVTEDPEACQFRWPMSEMHKLGPSDTSKSAPSTPIDSHN